MKRCIRTFPGIMFILLALIPALNAADDARPIPIEPRMIDVYVYPHELDSGDTLTDGNLSDRKFSLDDGTLLIWVDHQPGYRFAHRTSYILVSARQTVVYRGSWWPVLNGKTILHGNREKYTVASPFRLPGLEGTTDEYIMVYAYTHELDSRDVLTDGNYERAFKLDDNTMFLWIDLHPRMRFAHPTLYLLLSDASIRVEKGRWWPVLNGRRILSGDGNGCGIVSPFGVRVFSGE